MNCIQTNIKILPRETTFQNYVTLFTSTDFLASMFHSIVIAVITSCISMLVSSMASYAFARYRFRGKNLALSGYPAVIHGFRRPVPDSAVLWCLIKLKLIRFSCCVGSFILYIYHTLQHMAPYLIHEEHPSGTGGGRKIDGANVPQLLYYVVMPLLKPGLIATGTYVFINSWNEYLFAVMFTTSNNRTLPVSLASLVGEYDLRWDIISAGAVAAMIPVVILFMFIQKNLVAGLTAGSVKG